MTLSLPLVLATQNPEKAREIVEILVAYGDAPLAGYSIDGVAFLVEAPERIAESLAGVSLPLTPIDVRETGATLEDNARIKAVALGDALGLLAIADDSGLEVDALQGAPGVHSARYAGADATDADNVELLLHELAGAGPSRRTARFVTVALARRPDGTEVVARGEIEGVITAAPRGGGGFGYDPVFVPRPGDGRTFAEMAPGEKHAISHRGRAFRALALALDRGVLDGGG